MLFALLAVLHFTIAAALLSAINLLSLAGWRRTQAAHWTQRARLLWPARKSNGQLLFIVPLACGGAQFSLFPDLPLSYLSAAVTGLLGATLGMWPLARALAPGMTFATWVRNVATGFFIRLLGLGVLIAAGIFMPRQFDGVALLITAGVVVFKLWFLLGGLLWLLRVTHLLAPPPERLAAIVSHTSDAMNVPLPRVWVLRGFGVNALALPVNHALFVTERALQSLPDEELTAVCAHEFAHLNEPRRVIFGFVLGSFMLLPIIFFKPAIAAWHWAGYFGILGAITLFSKLSAALRRRMEKRADSIATGYEGPSAGTYARALERLYEINHTPAVLRGTLTHPNLYDRLLASGVTPVYPRPAPPARFSWQYAIVFVLVALSAVCVINRLDREDHAPSTEALAEPQDR